MPCFWAHYKEAIRPFTSFFKVISGFYMVFVELDRNDYSATWCPHTKEGDFIMFPSYLSHCVKPGKPTPDYPRITIAFNFVGK